MLIDLEAKASKVGLAIHPGKTKVLFNGIGDQGGPIPGSTTLVHHKVEVPAADQSTAYLGRELTSQALHDTEMKHRVSRAWAKLGAYHKELTDRSYPLKSRIKLSVSVVAPCALYGCGVWTMHD